MYQLKQQHKTRAGLLGAICGGLLFGIPAIPQSGSAQAIAQTNPCPRIYYEEPFNSSYRVPQGCPPNAAGGGPSTPLIQPRIEAQPQGGTGQTPDAAASPPLPETVQDPVTTITPVGNAVSIKLINQTGAVIEYQVIGDTQTRTLAGESEVTLQGLTIPTTLTFRREDSGLLMVEPLTPTSGLLEVMMDETTDLSIDRTTLRIEESGAVFLN